MKATPPATESEASDASIRETARGHGGVDGGPTDEQRAIIGRRDGDSPGALEHCPPGSLGRAYFDFYQRYNLKFPGEPGGGDVIFVAHDFTHVLSGGAECSADFARIDHLARVDEQLEDVRRDLSIPARQA